MITALIALGMLLVAYGLMSTITTSLERPAAHTINDITDANTIWRADIPLGFEEAVARKKCPVPLPQGARHIQYVDFYEYGGFVHCMRFEAPLSVCREHAAQLIQAFNARNNETQKSNQAPLPVRPIPLDQSVSTAIGHYVRDQVEEAARASWFEPDKVTSGEMWGRSGSRTPMIIIDSDKGVFYYLRTD